MRKLKFLAVILVLCIILPAPAFAAKYQQLFRNDGYDMYFDTNVVKANGIVSFWVKSVLSDQAKEAVRKQLPKKLRKSPIEYQLEYFQVDTGKNKYVVKLSSVYAGGKEIYKEGSTKWLPLKEGTLAKAVWNNVSEYYAKKKGK